MPAASGRTIVLSSGLLGLAVLSAAGFAFRGRLAEEYWLWKLERGPEGDREVAARRLGEIGSVRAVPGLLRWVACAKRRPEDSDYAFGLRDLDKVTLIADRSPTVYGMVSASFRSMGEIAVPRLTELSGEQNADGSTRFWAKAMLAQLRGKPIMVCMKLSNR